MNITRYDNYEFETFYGDVFGNNYDEYVYPNPIEISNYSFEDDSYYGWNYVMLISHSPKNQSASPLFLLVSGRIRISDATSAAAK